MKQGGRKDQNNIRTIIAKCLVSSAVVINFSSPDPVYLKAALVNPEAAEGFVYWS